MNITQEEALPIEGDHREMCRFEKVDDARFQAVWNAIRRLIPKKETIGGCKPTHSFRGSPGR
jgi:hypothetical protein